MNEAVSTPVRPRHVMAVTGTRADFGLMRSTYALIEHDPRLSLSLLVTGMHLNPLHGDTVAEVRASGWRIAAEVPVDTHTRSALSMAQGVGTMVIGMADVLAREQPDLLLVLGDRGEMLAAAIAALHLGIPCVHVHGGERSGTVDDPVRHAISKLSAWHLVATDESAERLKRMGEPSQRVHVVGAPGLDGLVALAAAPLADVWPGPGPAPATFALVVFHPVVSERLEVAQQTQALSAALSATGIPLVWLAPNADAGGGGIAEALAQCAPQWPAGSVLLTHLRRDRFASLMRQASIMVGNSSAGIIEAASFGTPVVNVGDRQLLRERNPNVLDAAVGQASIGQALHQALAGGRFPPVNRYGDGHAGPRIIEQLATLPMHGLMEKTHVD